MIFYHGTSDVLPIKKVLLPPTVTRIKREEQCKKFTDKVFFTTSILSASMCAKKACKKYGGNPIIYIVNPIGQFFNTINTEYIADRAWILNITSRKKLK